MPVDRADAKLRYRSEAVPARIHPQTTGGFRLELDQPAYGVAPGQAAVLYEDGRRGRSRGHSATGRKIEGG